MSSVTLRAIKVHSDGYCSQERTSLPPIRTLQEGIELIEKILSKGVLCRHDVQDLNHAYQTIDLLERKMDVIPNTCNSQTALEKIIKRMKKIKANTTAEELISLYHLQQFVDQDLPLNQCFNDRLQYPLSKLAIAGNLPCCHSEAQFDQDVSALIGPNRRPEVVKVLDRKKAKLQQYELTKQAIQERKLELNKRRERKSQKYPAYFDDLLENGYIYLYDHLIQMRELLTRHERKATIEHMTFSNIVHVILEVREAIIQKIESSIPADREHVLFLLGSSGAGKSTTFCFLRADKMFLNGSHYESTSDKNSLIGHEGAISCTFLPTIEMIQGWAIVDFPGFEDTNEQLVSLGVEMALKVMVQKYSPKMLVLEAITNTEGRFANAAKLGSRLSRLLGDKKEHCILGITKYSKDVDFERIRAIEESQRKERSVPTAEEIQLNEAIKTLSSLKQPALEPTIQEKQRQLDEIRRKKEEEARQPLPETEEKTQTRKRVQEKECELLKQIGLSRAVQFCHLEDPGQVSLCFAKLSEPFVKEPSRTQLPVQMAPDHRLDPDDERLLEERFKRNLVPEMETKQNYDMEFEDFRAFEQKALESSLINAVFSRSNPEIGQFLHLPEVDPNIVRKYDNEVLDKCIDQCMKFVIRNLNVSVIDRILQEKGAEAPAEKVQALHAMKIKLRNFILGLLGEPMDDPQVAEQKWKGIQEREQTALDKVEKDFKIPEWAIIILHIPLLVPIGIYNLAKIITQGQAKSEAIGKVIDESCEQLKKMYDTLLQLNDIRKIIQKREAINEAFKSVEISLKSIDDLYRSIQSRINKVRILYGSEDWDRRVSSLSMGIPLSRYFEPRNTNHLSYLLALAYIYIESDLYSRFFIMKFSFNISSLNRCGIVFVAGKFSMKDQEKFSPAVREGKEETILRNDGIVVILKHRFSESSGFENDFTAIRNSCPQSNNLLTQAIGAAAFLEAYAKLLPKRS